MMEGDKQRDVRSCENDLQTEFEEGSPNTKTEEGRLDGTKVTEPSSGLPESDVPPNWRPRWPFSKRATILCGGGLFSGAGGYCAYMLTRKSSYDSDRFLLYNPTPPGQRWSRGVDLLIYHATQVGGYIGKPLLYVLEKAFGQLEVFLDHSMLFFYAQAFSAVAIVSPFAIIYGVRMARLYFSGDRAPTDNCPPIAQFDVDVNTQPSGDHSAGTSVTMSVSVDKGRLLRRLPRLLLAQTASTDSHAEEDQPLKPLDPLTTVPRPVFALVVAGFVSAPFLWLSTHLFFASVQFEWPRSDLLARVWCCHTGIVVAGMLALELGCGGLKRIFTPDSYYKNGSSSE